MRTKILLFLPILLSVVFITNAQVSKGKTLLGGSISYYNRSNPTVESFYSNLQIGTAVKANTVIGIIGGYSNNNYNSAFSSQNKADNFSAGIFLRKYKALAKRFYFFCEIDASYVHASNINDTYNSNQVLRSKSNGVAISFVPGVSYAVSKKMQIELSMLSLANLSYSHVSTIDGSLPAGTLPQKSNVYNANVNLNSNVLSNFGIGFKFLLGK